MTEVRNAVLTIHYIDGSVQKFSFTKSEESLTALSRIKESLGMNHALLALNDKVVMVPLTAVKYIEVYPKPDKLPPYVIDNVNLMASV